MYKLELKFSYIIGGFLLIASIFILISFTSALNKGIAERDEQENKYYAMLLEGYTVFLDGVEIKPSNIDIKNYKISFSDNNKSIYLTKDTRNNDTSFWFFPLPIGR